MTAHVVKAPAAVLAEVATLAERQLSHEEYAARAAIPIGDAERAETLALIAWFTRRYPTPADRLAYARRAYAAWTRAQRGE